VLARDPAAHVFIAESGDAGSKLDKGASPVFVLAMVIFEMNGNAATTMAAIDAFSHAQGFHTEFKFNQTSDWGKDSYFPAVARQPFNIREQQLVMARKTGSVAKN